MIDILQTLNNKTNQVVEVALLVILCRLIYNKQLPGHKIQIIDFQHFNIVPNISTFP